MDVGSSIVRGDLTVTGRIKTSDVIFDDGMTIDEKYAALVHTHAASVITEDASHRFVTDAEKSTWNAKSTLALGTSSSTAYRGDHGLIAYNHANSAHNYLSLSGGTITGNMTLGTGSSNTARIVLDISNAGSPQIELSDTGGDCYWSIGADDADNSLKIHGSTSSQPIINNLSLPFFEITTGGDMIVSGTISSKEGSTTATTSSWGTGSYDPYTYRKAVAITGVTTAHTPVISFQRASMAAANDANVSYVETYNGGIYLYSDAIPSQTLTFDYKIF